MDYLGPLRYGALRSTTDHYKSALKIEEPEDFEIQGILSKELDSDDIDQNLAWLMPNKPSTDTEDQDQDLDDIDQSLAWLRPNKSSNEDHDLNDTDQSLAWFRPWL